MEHPKRLIPPHGRAALLVSACLLSPLSAGETKPAPAPAAASTTSAVGIEEAQELLLKGDESYTAGRYSEAVQAFSGAREMIPDAPETAELRFAATERYVQASVQHGRNLARKGDIAGAKAAINQVLVVVPKDPVAVAFLGELNDPIRTNPALDIAHAKNVDEVRQLLYTAEGAFDLGKFDQSKSTYEQVINLDPYNTAARRGLERIANAKGDYQRAASDHARAEFLSQVDGAWESDLEPLPIDPDLPADSLAGPATSFIPVANKIERIIIPRVSLEQSSLSEAIDFLRLKVSEVEGELGGVNFALNLGNAAQAEAINSQRFDLQLSNLPLSGVLKYLTDLTRTSFTTDEFSVVISPLGGGGGNDIISRTFRVPPDFISSLSASAPAASTAAEDPFGDAAPRGGLLAKRLGAKEALELQGIAFPEGASASYNSANSTLRVSNTASNLDIISQIIETSVQSEPVMVAVRVTMIKTEQQNLEELGFDWLLDNFGFGGTRGNSDGNQLNIGGGTQGNGGDLSDLAPDASGAISPITAGNRSGNTAISSNSIDNIIAQGNDRGTANEERAPGIFKVNGQLNGTNLTMLMRGLSQKKGVDLMTNPSTVTRSGQASSIQVVREFIYPTEYEPPEVPQTAGTGSTAVTPATPTAFTKRDVGVILEVLPTADANKQYVDVALNPSISEFDGFVNYGSPINTTTSAGALGGTTTIEITPNDILMPVFSAQRVNTSVTVADGATIVIGGLMQDSIQNVEDQTPIFGSLPVVGRLFQSKARRPISTAIIFLVNVQLLDPTGRPYRGR